jgi:hypothetical protein
MVCAWMVVASLADAASVSVTSDNLLKGMTVSATSEYSGEYAATKAVDGLPEVSDWVSTVGAGTQILSVSGFDSAVGLIRLWSNTDIPVKSVAIRSSTNSIPSTNPGDYETSLVTTRTYDAALTGWTRNPNWENLSGDYYIDYAVSAPAGTRSLLFDFTNTANAWVRVEEVQAYSAVPEPTTMGLVVTAMLGIVAYAWRKRS